MRQLLIATAVTVLAAACSSREAPATAAARPADAAAPPPLPSATATAAAAPADAGTPTTPDAAAPPVPPATASKPPSRSPATSLQQAEEAAARYAAALATEVPGGGELFDKRRGLADLERERRRATETIDVAVKAISRTSLGAAAVTSTIERAFLTGLKTCYRDELSSRPAAGGTLELEVVVTTYGDAYPDSRPTGMAADFMRCVFEDARQWRFEAPEDDDGKATTARFRVTLTFTPPEPDAHPPRGTAPAADLGAKVGTGSGPQVSGPGQRSPGRDAP